MPALWDRLKSAFRGPVTPQPVDPEKARQVALVAFLMRTRQDDMDVIGDFGALLERLSDSESARVEYLRAKGTPDENITRELRLLHPESELPHPKARIREALQRVLTLGPPEEQRELYKGALLHLDSFAPDAEVPRSGIENIQEWARRRKMPPPE